MNVAEQLVSQLIDAGVHRVYGIVGDSLNPVVDAIRKSGGSKKGGIDWVHVRHEEAAAFAAAAEAQLTGKLAVCAGSCGPGNLHLINGLYDAQRSGSGNRLAHPQRPDRSDVLPRDAPRSLV